MAFYSLTKTETSKDMVNASNKLFVVEMFTINAYFISHNSMDIAYLLTCIGCVMLGMTMRIIILIKRATEELPLTKKTVMLHIAAALCVCSLSYFGWHEGLKGVWPFRLFGLPLYLALSSFASMYVINVLDKVSEMSAKLTPKIILSYLYTKLIKDDKSEEIK